MIKDLWDIGKEIFDLSDKFRQQAKEKRQSLSVLLQHIGEVIKDTTDKLANNIYPGGNCQQLELFSAELFNQTKEILGQDKATFLSDKLKQAHEVEKLLGDLQSGVIDKKDLQQLEVTSGYFIATSKIILV